MPLRLTKSDFNACADCPTRLYYRKNGYPSTNDNNRYLRLLADGSFMVEFIAKARFPNGTDLADIRDEDLALQRTRELISYDGAVIFGAAALHERYYVQTDILVRRGDHLDLIEVKSRGINFHSKFETFRNQNGGINSKWSEDLSDLAFQTHVVQEAFPHLTVTPRLCLVNKDHRAGPNETLDLFRLQHPEAPRDRPVVIYTGDPLALKDSRLLITLDATSEVAELMPGVLQAASALAALLGTDTVRKQQQDISIHYNTCRTCEFRVDPDNQRNGFRECWGSLADARPHLLDLHRVGQFSVKNEPDRVTLLLRHGFASLYGLTKHDLDGPGVQAQRRLLQWKHSAHEGTECLPPELRLQLAAHQKLPGYPLHFIAFAACNFTLPPNQGLHPYERVAFQWSCHTLEAAGNLVHREWLNTSRQIPNLLFVKTLRAVLGESGTIYVWSSYEQTTLKTILQQINDWRALDEAMALAVSGLTTIVELDDLAEWIGRLLGAPDWKGTRRSPRIRVLHDLALEFYFHTKMGGSTTIKVVLSSVWTANSQLRQHPWFSEYAQTGKDGQPLDPDKTLPALPLGEDDKEDVVQEGTGALRVYQDLIFRSDHAECVREQRQKLLRQYCKLNTAAMVMIWAHWTGTITH